MRRSQINALIAHADDFIRSFGHVLPPFAYITPQQFKARKADLAGIIDARLGWDVTDYGKGDFSRTGLFLFTTRNGNAADLKTGRGMLYAEKIMISRRDQIAPMHRHDVKAEDIINRGGGTLALKLFMPAPDGSIDDRARVHVPCDGVMRELEAGGVLRLVPGESVTLLPGVWHAFWGEDKDVLIGEVSTVNDDETDNVFAEPVSRFSAVEEDVEPTHLLVSDYSRWLG
ncbi:D-lyxose/D-mannose family sugar isomerase [Mesorhizobium sp. CAU 1741]|uniref:D-lyxose/D-mannose family sugar isomerase n=1 Tax=Mesorhizobium sp. CAU 1741 TaxID=3140366 RepID=UPI00325BADE4